MTQTSPNDLNNPTARLNAAPRCGARAKRTGQPCQSPAIKGKARCRMHGGRSTGPPKGNKNALRHGKRSAEARAIRFHLAVMARLLTRRYGNPGGYSFHPRLATTFSDADLRAIQALFGKEAGEVVMEALQK
jgi:hypothetical protein